MLDFQVRKLGATSSFETIVAFGPNASRPHHQPTTKKLKRQDTVLIDFGAKYKGYCSDITRCFAIGRASTFYKKVYDVVEQAQLAAIKMVKAGVEIVRVDAAAREVIRKTDLPVYGHGTGHGFGLEIHELPYLKPESKGKLKAGQIITIEPGVYIPGKVGVRIEDDIPRNRDRLRDSNPQLSASAVVRPGQKLNTPSLQKEFCVSVTPPKKLLRKLAPAEGLKIPLGFAKSHSGCFLFYGIGWPAKPGGNFGSGSDREKFCEQVQPLSLTTNP